jgi:hypothetical protein
MATTTSNNNSGDTNSGSDGNGSSNDGSNNNGSTPPPGSPIDGLTTNLDQIKDSGPPDIKLSTATRDEYLKVIKTFRTALQTQRDKMNTVQPLGDPGALGSAIQTKANLELDVHGPGGITETTDKYLKYLDDFSDTVNKAATRLIQSG